jgi:electron transfer flavoprotein alpha subunit
MSVLVFVEGLNGEIKKSSLEAASYGSQVAQAMGTTATAVAIGEVHEEALTRLGEQGITKVLYDADDRLKQFVADAYVKVIATAAQQESAKVLGVLQLQHRCRGRFQTGCSSERLTGYQRNRAS